MHTDHPAPPGGRGKLFAGLALLSSLLCITTINADTSAPPPRQTEFNENNYRPREIVNRLPPPPASAAPRNKSAVAKTVTRSAKWSWKQRQSITRGTFKWHERNGRIDYASVCMNEKRGSLRYRDCRKGAKQAFARLCKAHRDPAACHAENNYSPLR